MANEEHLRILKRSVAAWNEWRRKSDTIPDLLGADLRAAKLSDANLSDADLTGADLCDADLFGADLSRANLVDAHFNDANLRGTVLNGANFRHSDFYGTDLFGAALRDADLRDTNLYGADFRRADLRGAILNGAALYDTTFADCDLRQAKGLEFVLHIGPSIISISTIYMSEGQIPESFLRGCGVPESFILQMRSLVGAEEGMQFHSCFISYSHKDEEFAQRLHERMRAANLRVWYAPEDMKAGRKIHEQIETQIHVHDKLLLVLSEHSMASEWVATEIYHTRQREKKEGRQILFPIRLCPFEEIRAWKCFDADTGKDMAREVREYLIPDFSDWKNHDRFEAGFDKLLRDLRRTEKQS